MKTIQLEAYAKINLSLDVIAKRPDGYHDLASVMQSIDLADTICIAQDDSAAIAVTTDCAALDNVADNLAYRAARHFNAQFGINCGYRIDIVKRIPLGAGLAGGSADAAAVLKGLAQLHGLPLDDAALFKRAAQLGADVPFCLLGGTALAEGIGERLTPLASKLAYHLVLVKPKQAISTAQVFKNFKFDAAAERLNSAALIAALAAGDLERAKAHMGNVLERVTSRWVPEIEQIKAALYNLGATYAQMTGSGSTVFAIFEDEKMAQAARLQLAKDWREVFVAKPMKS